MKRLSLSQSRTFLGLMTVLTLVFGFQNCGKSGLSAGGSSSSGGFSLAVVSDPSQDPLLSSSGVGNEVVQSGAIYNLDHVNEANGSRSDYTVGAFKLQFSALNAIDESNGSGAILKSISLFAVAGCTQTLNGTGQMARYQGWPLQLGSLTLQPSNASATAAPNCVAALSSKDVDLSTGTNYAVLLSHVRLYSIQAGVLSFYLDDGRQVFFNRTGDGDITTMPVRSIDETILRYLRTPYTVASVQKPNPCADTDKTNSICVQRISVKNYVSKITVSLQNTDTLVVGGACGMYLFKVNFDGQSIADPFPIKLTNGAVVATFLGQSCTSTEAADLEEIRGLVKNAAALTGTDANLILITAEGSQIRLKGLLPPKVSQ